MEFMLRIVAWFIAAVVIGLLLWFSLTIVAVMLCVGIGLAVITWVYRTLVAKGIVNETPGAPPVSQPGVTVIEVDYERVEDKR